MTSQSGCGKTRKAGMWNSGIQNNIWNGKTRNNKSGIVKRGLS